jgi:hypothetical protein
MTSITNWKGYGIIRGIILAVAWSGRGKVWQALCRLDGGPAKIRTGHLPNTIQVLMLEPACLVTSWLSAVWYMKISAQMDWCRSDAVDLYWGGAQFECQPGHWLSWRFFVVFFSHYANARTVPWLGYDYFHSNPSEIHIKCCVVLILTASWNNEKMVIW